MADSVKIKITGDDSDYRSKMNGLGSIAKKAALAITAALGISAGAFIKYNADMESYLTSFEVMTGSAEDAASVMEKIKKISAETPFETKDIADATQLLMNYGLTADESLGTFKMLGDISQGNADKLNRIAMAYGQMSSAGKVSLEDVKQMIEAGFNPLQEISETTGESMASLYDRISKGTISVDEITASMERSTAEGGKYFESMDKQSQTLAGRFSTLKDNVFSTFGDLLKPFTDYLRDEVIPAAIEFLESLDTDKIIKNVKTAVSTIIEVVKKGTPVVLALVAAWEAFKFTAWIGQIGGMGSALKLLNTKTLGLVATKAKDKIMTLQLNAMYAKDAILKGASTAKTVALTVAQKAAAAGQWLLNAAMSANPAALIIIAIIALIAALVLLWKKCDKFREAVLSIWEGIKEAWDAAQPYLQAAWEVIKSIFSAALGVIISIFQTAWTVIKAVWDFVQPYFAALWEAIKIIFSVVVTVLGGFFSGAWEAIKFIWDLVGPYFEMLWEVIKGIFSVVKAVLSGDFSAAWEAIKGIWNAVKGYFSGIWQGIKDVFAGIRDWFSEKFQTAFNAIKDWFTLDNFKEIFKDTIVGGLEGIVEDVKTAASDIWEAIKEAMSKAIKVVFGFGGEGEGGNEYTSGNNGSLSPFAGARISSPYGVKRSNGKVHRGVDFAIATGTPIQSTTAGMVVTSGYNAGGFGNYVVVEDGNGNRHYYGHMSKRNAVVGRPVMRGTTIGYVGSTGHSTGPHLHYEVRVDGKAVNPKAWYSSARGYATGGFPLPGELFFANENGIEMMGKMGSQNVVANNMQIIEGIKAGIASGMVQAARAKGSVISNSSNVNIEQHFYKEQVSPSETKRATRRGIKAGLAGGTA